MYIENRDSDQFLKQFWFNIRAVMQINAVCVCVCVCVKRILLQTYFSLEIIIGLCGLLICIFQFK